MALPLRMYMKRPKLSSRVVCSLCCNFHESKFRYNTENISTPKSNDNSSTLKNEEDIYQKYKTFLKNVSSDKRNEEVVYSTNFGSIRFDFENVVSEEIQNLSSLSEQDEKSLESNSCDFNYIDELCFKDALDNIEKSVHQGEVEREVDPKNVHFNNPDHMNYIDSQYIISDSSKPDVHRKEDQLKYVTSGYSRERLCEADELNSTSTLGATIQNTNLYNFEDSISDNDAGVTDSSFKVSESPAISIQNVEEEFLKLSENARNLFKKRQSKKEKFHTEIEEPLYETTNQNSVPEEEASHNQTEDFKKPSSLSVLEYVKAKRKQENIENIQSVKGQILPHENYKNIILQVPRFTDKNEHDMACFFKKSVLHHDNDIVAIFKPYGIPVHGGASSKTQRYNVHDLLPPLAKMLKIESLELVHRLDMQTTGVLLLSKNPSTSEKLKYMFKNQMIRKTYLAITKGVPSSLKGLIDIPISEGKIGNMERMALRPDVDGFRGRPGRSKKAITKYRVLSCTNSAALLELSPLTGVKHQLRVHLGFGLNCPVLGDHKYSHLTKIAPQKLPGDLLDAFGMKQSAARHLPMHLHAFSIAIPGLESGGPEINIRVGPPKFFKTSLRTTKRKNRLVDDYSEEIFGY